MCKHNYKQLKRGTRTEAKEHHLGRRLSRKIACDHLKENKKYYTYLTKMEKRMKRHNKKRYTRRRY